MRIGCLTLLALLSACAATPGGGDFAQVEPAAVAPAPMDLDANLARLSEWFAGEWDNYEQVVAAREQSQGNGAPAHERVHALFLPVSVPAIGGSVFFARQTLDDDPARVFRLRLYRFAVDAKADAIRLDQYSFNNEKAWRDAHRAPDTLAQLTSGDLRYSPDCAVYFRFDAAADEFVGSTVEGACKVASERLAKAVIVEDRLQLGRDKLWILSTARDEGGRLIYGNPQGIPHKQRKVRYFRGWIAINKAGATAGPEQRAFHTVRNVVLHSEGRVVPIVMDDGRRSGYSVQIARLSFQGDSVRALTLNLLNDATGQPASYAWADPESKRIGINLKWFQSDFAEAHGDSRFEPAEVQ
jgi:hypothetical protein